ncbi:HIT domain-containing protein [Lentzea sp. NPDC005914]|uniref:HIT family protein n=1 Tax=Lentzea sp. NPDC005914 TaxID=3154572 RepID=UPI0033F335DB
MDENGGCVFCTIVAGEAEASVVCADERAVAFMDLGAVTPGHVMVVPRAHAVGWRTWTRRRAPTCSWPWVIAFQLRRQPTIWTISRPGWLSAAGWVYPAFALVTLVVIAVAVRGAGRATPVCERTALNVLHQESTLSR